jgi:hypothetical protein
VLILIYSKALNDGLTTMIKKLRMLHTARVSDDRSFFLSFFLIHRNIGRAKEKKKDEVNKRKRVE